MYKCCEDRCRTDDRELVLPTLPKPSDRKYERAADQQERELEHRGTDETSEVLQAPSPVGSVGALRQRAVWDERRVVTHPEDLVYRRQRHAGRDDAQTPPPATAP